MMTTNKKLFYGILAIVVLVIVGIGLFFYLGKAPNQQIGPEIKPCHWVFKTDPTNIGHISGVLNPEKTMVVRYGGQPSDIKELNNEYFTMSEGCSKDFDYTKPSNYVFFKATTLEEFQAYGITGENVGQEKISAAIKDAKPFNELYFCEPCLQKDLFEGSCYPSDEIPILNKIIGNNELNTRCERVI
jgi:hypothetical protein